MGDSGFGGGSLHEAHRSRQNSHNAQLKQTLKAAISQQGKGVCICVYVYVYVYVCVSLRNGRQRKLWEDATHQPIRVHCDCVRLRRRRKKEEAEKKKEEEKKKKEEGEEKQKEDEEKKKKKEEE